MLSEGKDTGENMDLTDEFMKTCIDTLEVNFGQLSTGIINKAKSKVSLNENSSLSDFNKFINAIESNVVVLSGKNSAKDICNTLRTKAVGMTEKQKQEEFARLKPGTSLEMDDEIKDFLRKNTLPTQKDIAEYTKRLTIKYGRNAKEVEKVIIENVRRQVKEALNKNKLTEEISKFLNKFPQPSKTDIDDFINYTRILKFSFPETELRELIEKERLYRKFHAPQVAVPTSELDQFVDLIKAANNSDAVSKIIRKQEVSYLIKDDSGISDKSLSEFLELATPSEKDLKDTLEGIGLKHLIKK